MPEGQRPSGRLDPVGEGRLLGGVAKLGPGPSAPAADLGWFPTNERKWAHTRTGGGQWWAAAATAWRTSVSGVWPRVRVMGSDPPPLLRAHLCVGPIPCRTRDPQHSGPCSARCPRSAQGHGRDRRPAGALQLGGGPPAVLGTDVPPPALPFPQDYRLHSSGTTEVTSLPETPALAVPGDPALTCSSPSTQALAGGSRGPESAGSRGDSGWRRILGERSVGAPPSAVFPRSSSSCRRPVVSGLGDSEEGPTGWGCSGGLCHGP